MSEPVPVWKTPHDEVIALERIAAALERLADNLNHNEAMSVLKYAADDITSLPTREHLAQVIHVVTAAKPPDSAFAYFRKLHEIEPS